MTLLRIGDGREGLRLPLDTVTSTLIAYGGKGMGKTNLGSVLVEELTRCGLRWSWLDPLGVSWGLRHSADGTGAGVECLILGGLHGDVPIEPEGGAVVADVVVEESTNVLIDFSRKASGEMWSIAEKIRFVTAYTLRLFQRQGQIIDGKRRPPLFQVLDEAARYIPQVIPAKEGDLARCVGAWNQLVEEGRNVGVGVGLLTQRSARMNKSVSELADAMFSFRIVGPNSLAAVLEWLGEHVEKDRIKTLATTVRSLERGRALVVSPGWLQFEGVVEVRKRETFDSSATIKHGERARVAKGEGARPDLTKIRERMRDAIEKAKAEDPRELRKIVADLRAQLSRAHLAGPPAKAPKTIERPVLKEAQVKRLEVAGDRAIAEFGRMLDVLSQRLQVVVSEVGLLRGAMTVAAAATAPTRAPSRGSAWAQSTDAPAPRAPAPPPPRPLPGGPWGNGDARARLGGRGELAILKAVAQYAAGLGVTREQITLLAGYKKSSRDTYLYRLREAGLVEERGELVIVTAAGLAALGPDFDPLPVGDELRRYWRGRLTGGELRIFDAVVGAYPRSISRDAITSATAYAKSSRDTYLYRLALRKIITADRRGGEVRAADELFG